MKHLAFLAMVALCCTVGASAQSHHASGPPPAETQITTHNETDMPVRMTAFSGGGGTLVSSWSMAPHASDSRTLRAYVVVVRADIDAGPCSGTWRYSGQLTTTPSGRVGNVMVYHLTGYVRHVGGRCSYR
ncbi:MAG TPA: hypothetical protein VIG46_06035 [Candidatus Baltobacteraceae bacterium]|jgi:hypothetical protein